MKTVLVICSIFAISNAHSLVVPIESAYTTNIGYLNEQPPQLVDLVSDEEQLLSKRVGRQYYSNDGLPTQNYGGYVPSGYSGYYQPSYPNYNRRSYQSQRRRRFGGIGSAIIV